MYLNKTEQKIEKLLSQMTLHEKVLCCHASEKFATAAIPRLGIPPLTMSDGPHGVREEIRKDSWDPVGGDADYATCLPTGSALAATWNVECAKLFGTVLGAEARERCKDVILGPGVNIVRNPLCGRNFEYYGEDPYENGRLAAAAIKAIQKQGTAACVKHFALNSQELNRMQVDARCDERTLREIYLPAFEAAVKEGGVLTVMGAYNKFNGQYCCHNDMLLNQILKKEWGFSGLVISDWSGVHDTFEAARGGMDLEMGTCKEKYSDYYLADAFQAAVEKGEIDEAILDDKVRRYLRVMFAIGLLGDKKRPVGSRNTNAHTRAARKIAEEAMVLLKNEWNTLPFDLQKVKKVLAVGENADRKHALGGHSSAIKTAHEITPLEGLRTLLGKSGIEVEYIKGYPPGDCGEEIPSSCMGLADPGAGTRGWICELRRDRASSKIDCSFVLEHPSFDFERDLPEEFRGTEFGGCIRGEFTAPESGEWTFFCQGASQTALCCEGDSNWIEHCKSMDDITASSTITLEKGRTYKLYMNLYIHVGMPLYNLHLTFMKGRPAAAAGKNLLRAARSADAVIFFGGQNHNTDCEGSDRKDMQLHDGQNELISRLAEVNRNFAVVLVGGSPVEMPWIDKVPAVLQMWYAGQEGGHAVADILFGRVNPSGKLPVTFPRSYAESPVGANGDYHFDVCSYQESVLVGYRWFDMKKIKPLFPFGHGLSYTKFSLGDARLEKPDKGMLAACSFELKNTGKRAGSEVVQLYVEPPKLKGVVRPVRELKGFAKCELASGKSCRVKFQLDARAFSCYDAVRHQWIVVPGLYKLRAGTSSEKIIRGIPIIVGREK